MRLLDLYEIFNTFLCASILPPDSIHLRFPVGRFKPGRLSRQSLPHSLSGKEGTLAVASRLAPV